MRHEHVVVMPVYEDGESFVQVLADIRAALGCSAYIVAVDDGSVAQPVDEAWIGAAGLSGVVLRLHRNMGHQRAIAIGLNYVAETMDADRVVVMDSDGEDRAATIGHLFAALEDENVDIAVASRKSRVETWRFKLFYAVYKQLFALLVGKQYDFGNFMAMRRRGLRRLTAMSELWIHVAASVIASKLRIRHVPLDRGPRYAGKTKMNFVALAVHGFRGVMVFAEDVLVRLGVFCAIMAGLVALSIAVAIGLKIAGGATPGWFSNVVISLVLVFMQTGALTLMTLLTTGVIKSVTARPPDYRSFIDETLDASPEGASAPKLAIG